MPDAIHLATAIKAAVQQFLTHDTALQRMSGVRVMPLAKERPGGTGWAYRLAL